MDDIYENPMNEQAESEAELQDGGQEGVVAPENGEESAPEQEVEAAEGEDAGGEPADGGQAQKAQQTHQDNAAAKAARIRAERETEARVRRELDEEVANMGLVDPYTNQPIRTQKDLKAYTERHREAQLRERAERENRPLEELRREAENQTLAEQKRRELEESQKKADADKKQQDFLMQDAADFMARHPEVDIMKLQNNQNFREFCGSRFGREPLADLYESYLKFANGAAAQSKAQSKAARSVGGGTGSAGSGLTAEQQRALDKWNRDNPEMRMTAKEFLSR